ncbi:hypothetical protein AGMMS49975_02260 [Clostridia bacterium]|nr:hypothetical protein AGMMS49975_02260 [Clostridia bacterium]
MSFQNANTANGGLAVKFRNDIVFARPNEYFLNAGEEFVFYSDRNDGDKLYRSGGVILKRPCSGVILQNGFLYFADEEDKGVYRCTQDGKDLSRLTDKNVSATEFALLPNGEIYTNQGARRLFAYENACYFADAKNGFALTKFDSQTGETSDFPEIVPSYINACGEYVYYTDRRQSNIIYRLDSSKRSLKIFGGSALCLHVLDDWLYFISDNVWKRVSLSRFGDAELVRTGEV